jgi:hypothetical protein
MGPHPYIVTVLIDEHEREIQSDLTRRQWLHDGVDASIVPSSSRQSWGSRLLKGLRYTLRHREDTAVCTSVGLETM